MTTAVDMRGIGKSFGVVQALNDVDLTVQKGAIHALVGENGAGKTTLMRVLYGALQADAGRIHIHNQPAIFRNSAQAIEAGIGMVSQHYSIIPELTCLQNLMLGAELGPLLNQKAARQRADEMAAKMGFQFEWNRSADTLSPAQAQKLEILKLLWREADVMILDEPTAMLSPADSDALFESLKRLVKEGRTVIVVTHRLPEVMEHCHHATVLRNGQKVADVEIADTPAATLAELIVGHAVSIPTKRAPPSQEETLLKLNNVSAKGQDGALQEVNLGLRKGEILGIAGVDGNGQRELFRAIYGQIRLTEGEITLGGHVATHESTAGRIQQGLRLIPEDRHEEGLIEEWSLEENAALGLQGFHPFAKNGLINRAARREAAQKIAERFGTRHGSLDDPISSLSGGNQQRFVAGRALHLTPRVLLAFQPARGLDIDATRAVYEGIREECERGAAAMVVSFDLDELLSWCDRIVVMGRGRVYEPKDSLDRNEIGRLMVGAE